MRLDKFLKVSRIIKRRTVAKQVCSKGKVLINDQIAKPATTVNAGDVLDVNLGYKGRLICKVLEVAEGNVSKSRAPSLYEVIEEIPASQE
jgi:ribosomal 50S subunit-recycling heat shock protein